MGCLGAKDELRRVLNPSGTCFKLNMVSKLIRKVNFCVKYMGGIRYSESTMKVLIAHFRIIFLMMSENNLLYIVSISRGTLVVSRCNDCMVDSFFFFFL